MSGRQKAAGNISTRLHTAEYLSTNAGPQVLVQEAEQTSSNQRSSSSSPFEAEWRVEAMVRAGILVTDDLLAYGLVGATRAGFDGMPFSTRNGLVLGGGLEHRVGKGWFIHGEYRFTNFASWKHKEQDLIEPSFNADSGSTSSGSTHLDMHVLTVGLAKRF